MRTISGRNYDIRDKEGNLVAIITTSRYLRRVIRISTFDGYTNNGYEDPVSVTLNE